ncbi:MAG: YeeE/YedE family protein [Anaerolineales bacterium]|nr:YeeE/YedE family protein [Anaerolineales bacterium]MCB0006376.1 YeeE/YedE family protein [Anaerolineales bacterium]MCB0010440.1 YeeE/YedE family protein [Anaerolineales bacterium]MCB0017776.1 YeeE/YedE family protein [Anaerolineales bacterium]MCB0026941.1 YeeE/YedE family protein [Anaerolineales bacterium]
MEWIMQPWPWWLSGILIGLTVPALYFAAGKAFGISTSLQHLGAMCAPNSRHQYLREHNWVDGMWNLVFVLGIVIGGLIAANWLSSEPVAMLPESAYSLGGVVRLLVGGVLVGFGTRYAGGCTSGHSITGLANLNWPSLVATISFFIGGIIVTWGLGDLIF